jgi:hypothetical protein
MAQSSRAMYGKNSFAPLDDVTQEPTTADISQPYYMYDSSSAPSGQRTYQPIYEQSSKDPVQVSIPPSDNNYLRVRRSALDDSAKEPWSWWTTVWTAASFVLCPGFVYCTLAAVICNIFAYVITELETWKADRTSYVMPSVAV